MLRQSFANPSRGSFGSSGRTRNAGAMNSSPVVKKSKHLEPSALSVKPMKNRFDDLWQALAVLGVVISMTVAATDVLLLPRIDLAKSKPLRAQRTATNLIASRETVV